MKHEYEFDEDLNEGLKEMHKHREHLEKDADFKGDANPTHLKAPDIKL